MKNVIAWFAENHVAANLLMIFLLLAGITTGLSIKLEVFPETALDKIIISTVYFGASPSEVEEAVVRKIEEKIDGLSGIKRIDSTSREGFGTVTVEAMKGWDVSKLLDEIKAEVDRITTLPKEAEKPVVRELIRRIQVINVAVYGDVQESTIKYLAEKVRDDITNIQGITLADVSGVRESEIHIEISENTLRRFGITLGSIAKKIAENSLDLPAGSIKTEEGEILVRTKGRRYYAKDYSNIAVITRADGTRLTLGQIADIKEGFEDTDLYARFQGKPAAMINVYRVANQNALDVANKVKAYLKKNRDYLPSGVEMACYRDMSKLLKSRIKLLIKNMAIGLVLVSILLGIFLNMRLAFWVTLGIPISFAVCIALLPQMDVSINMISLFAFIMVLGIVVDDAIIVGENVFRYQEQELSHLNAAVKGTTEVGMPVIFSILTTMVAFWPLLLAGGTFGKFMRNIPIVVILVLAGSLIESLLILPAHLSRLKTKPQADLSKGKKKKIFVNLLSWIISNPYTRLIHFCVTWRYATIAFGFAVLLLTIGMWQGGLVKFVFFPKVEGDVIECLITMPTGTPAHQTHKVVEYLEKTAMEVLTEADSKRPADALPLLEHSSSLIGAQFGRHTLSDTRGSHLAQIWLQLLDGEIRDVSSIALSNSWRKKAGSIPGAESVIFKSILRNAGNAIEIHLSANDNDMLINAVNDLKNELKSYEGVYDINDSFMPGKKEMQLKLKHMASVLDITLNDLASQVRHAIYGAESLRFQRNKDEIKVLVRYPEKKRNSISYIENMRIRTKNGIEIPFSQVAEINMRQGYTSIQRAQRKRIIKIIADVDEKITNANEVRQNLIKNYLPQLIDKYPDLSYILEGEGKEQAESLGDIYKGFTIALFCIYALLAIPFKSFTQPLIVMAAIPFGIVGALIGHVIMGYNISFISIFGIVGLSGVVVNDSLVLIYRINFIRNKGKSAYDSVVRAGILRFRAIILTSITTFAGLAPMLAERSLQAKFLIPMAISLGFGIIFATIITLIFIPCGYMILDDFQQLFSKTKIR